MEDDIELEIGRKLNNAAVNHATRFAVGVQNSIIEKGELCAEQFVSENMIDDSDERRRSKQMFEEIFREKIKELI